MFHASGQRPGQSFLEVREAGKAQKTFEGVIAVRACNRAQIGIQSQVLLDAEILVKTKPLRHVRHDPVDGAGIADGIKALNGDFARIGNQQACDQSQERCLAGAVRANKAGHFASADAGCYVVERGQVALGKTLGKLFNLDERTGHAQRVLSGLSNTVTGMPCLRRFSGSSAIIRTR